MQLLMTRVWRAIVEGVFLDQLFYTYIIPHLVKTLPDFQFSCRLSMVPGSNSFLFQRAALH